VRRLLAPRWRRDRRPRSRGPRAPLPPRRAAGVARDRLTWTADGRVSHRLTRPVARRPHPPRAPSPSRSSAGWSAFPGATPGSSARPASPREAPRPGARARHR
jgi:hypothetical protein